MDHKLQEALQENEQGQTGGLLHPHLKASLEYCTYYSVPDLRKDCSGPDENRKQMLAEGS